MKTISVLVLAPTYPDSNNIIKQNHIHNQLQSYQRHGLLPMVIDLAPSVTGVRRDLFEGIPVIRFGVRPRGWLRGVIFRLVFQGKLRALLRKTLPQFDVVHVHNCMVQLRPLLALLQTKPLVVTCYGGDVYPSKTASLERDRRIFLRGAKMITAISQYTARLASHYVGESVEVAIIPVGVRADVFSKAAEEPPSAARSQLALPADRKIVLMACSLIERKGVMQVLEAFRTVHHELPEAFLVVVGTGELQLRMKQYIAANGLQEVVRMIDYVDDDSKMALYYRAVDLYVMLSKTVENPLGAGVEGFGISYTDANAVGVAVIGGRSGGVEDAVVDGQTGFLVDPDCPETVPLLAGKMRQLLGDDAMRNAMGKAGQKRVYKYLTWDQNVQQTRAVYAGLLS